MPKRSNWRTTVQRQMNAYALTPAEQRVAWALFRAQSNDELSAELGTSTQTVKNQLTSMMRKTATKSRLALVLTLLDLDDERL